LQKALAIFFINMGGRHIRKIGKISYGLVHSEHRSVHVNNSLAVFDAYIASNRRGLPGIRSGPIYLPHPALEEGGLSRLSWSMEYPIKLVLYVAVQLGAHQPFLRGEHVMVVRVTGAGGIEKSNFAFAHYEKYIAGVDKVKGKGRRPVSRRIMCFQPGVYTGAKMVVQNIV
jgi:hypothetical protein